MKNHVIIDSDVLNILERLKEIDESYFLVFDVEKQKIEVHSSLQLQNTYCFTCPFEFLDERLCDYARKTSISRRDDLIEEMDLQNQMWEKQMIKTHVDNLREVLE